MRYDLFVAASALVVKLSTSLIILKRSARFELNPLKDRRALSLDERITVPGFKYRLLSTSADLCTTSYTWSMLLVHSMSRDS